MRRPAAVRACRQMRCSRGVRALPSTRSIYTLRTAVSFCAKGPFANANKHMGEDAAIVRTWITPGSYQGASLIGVADGVGGWKRHGVDPSFLSHGLLAEMGRLFKRQQKLLNKGDLKSSGSLPGSERLLRIAFRTLFARGSDFAGGTTVCTGQFNPQTAEIEIVNLGDSGAWLLRNHQILFKTEADVHGMTPRQLTILPEWMSPSQIATDLDPAAQTANARILHWQLQPGDLLLFASDGFFDNVSGDETLDALAELRAKHTGRDVTTRQIADALLATAYRNSLNPELASPFALRCLKEDDSFDYWGGKPDDITIVVCSVYESELDFPDSPPRAAGSQVPKAPASVLTSSRVEKIA